ncbi:MarR family winged helix-turn-helix transcriptional regulator [Gaopeijia maritima]|uniref:MarR family transcriptional regulator n=1 Tax=Gaopeijia maritima TaxID=3119007 RepID=A0ABU9ECN7_9BACT
MSDNAPKSVAEEIGQRVPFASPGQEVMVALMRSADVLRGWLASEVAKVDDVTLQQYNVLRILRGAGEEGLPTLAIAERMIERQPGVTRLVDRLLAKGLVDRARSARDRRVVRCAITPEGLATLERLDGVIDECDARIREAVGDERLGELIPTLDCLRAALRDD